MHAWTLQALLAHSSASVWPQAGNRSPKSSHLYNQQTVMADFLIAPAESDNLVTCHWTLQTNFLSRNAAGTNQRIMQKRPTAQHLLLVFAGVHPFQTLLSALASSRSRPSCYNISLAGLISVHCRSRTVSESLLLMAILRRFE